MATYRDKVQRTKYCNWIKAGLALLITKDGIEEFVYDEIEQFQIQSLRAICATNTLSSGTVCSSCCTINILVCPTSGVCKVKYGTCTAHDGSSNQYRVCPNKICDEFLRCIKDVHRYHGPSFKNTDATKWCSDVWEVAKCFMPAGGYTHSSTAAETDFSGVLSVIINHKGFQNKIADDLKNDDNIVTRARKVSNQVRHSSDLEVDTPSLAQYFKDLENLLSDKKYLANDRKAQDALDKLRKLLNDTLFIRAEDIQKVLDDATSLLQTRMSSDADRHKQDILTKASDALFSLQTEKQNALDAVAYVLSSGCAQLELVTEEAKSKILAISRTECENLAQLGKKERTLTQQAADNANKTLENVSKDEQEKIRDFGDEISEAVKECGRKEKEDLAKIKNADEAADLESFERDLQQRLVSLYKTRCRYLPISPLLKEEEELLEDFYIRPSMQRVDHHKAGIKPIPLRTFEDVFSREGQRCYRIFVTGDAGTGKTVFCQRMLLAWCEAMTGTHTADKVKQTTDVNYMKQFRFVFFVSLRDAAPNECYIHQIISTQLGITENKGLLKVFQNENCLILIDGLDEWSHPDSVQKCIKESGQPHLDFTESCTIVSTSRPWKLDVLQLGKRDIDHKIEITGFQNPMMMRKYVEKVIGLLNKRTEPEGNKTVVAFEEKITDIVDEDLKTNPLLVLNLVCLWFTGNSLGPSKCKIYSDSLEMMLKRSSDRDGEFLCHQQLSDLIENGSLTSMPKVCFQGNSKCQEHLGTLYFLGRLAFNTLFRGQNEGSSLVFERSLGGLNGLSSEQIKSLCIIGILSQSKVTGNLLTRKSKVSFIHKTYHEFFAALYMCLSGLLEDIIDDVKKTCHSVEKIVEMKNVFIFLSGMSPHVLEKLGPFLRTIINEDPLTKSYRRMIDQTSIRYIFEKRVIKAMRHLEALACDCYRECKHVTGIELRFPVEDFFIEFQTSAQKLTLLKLSTVKSIAFEDTFIYDFDKSYLEKLSFLFSYKFLSKAQVFHTSFIKEMSTEGLKCLVLDYGNGGRLFIDEILFLHFLQSVALKQLEVFSLENVILRTNTFKQLTYILRKCQHLKQLRLVFVGQGLPEHGHLDCALFKSLEELTLTECCIDIYINNSKLEKCCIHSSGLKSLVAPKLSSLTYYLCRETNVLASVILTFKHLRQLRLCECDFSETDAALLLDKSMKDLNYISLHDVSFTEKGFKEFLSSFPSTESPIDVDLERCRVVFEDHKEMAETSKSHTWIQCMVKENSRFQVVFTSERKLKFKAHKQVEVK